MPSQRKPSLWPAVIVAICFLCFFCFRFIAQQAPVLTNPDDPPMATLPADSPRTRQLMDQMAHVQLAMRDRQFETALDLAGRMEAQVMHDPALEPDWVARFLDAKGDIHVFLWQHVEALACWKKAVFKAEPAHQAQLVRKIQHIGKVLAALGSERHLRAQYQAMPGTGPARALKGKVAVIYLFIQMDGTGGWGMKQRDTALRSWASAKAWLSHWAARYQQTVTFSERLFVLDRSPELGRMPLASGPDTVAQAGSIVRQAIKELNGESPQAFIDRIKAEEQADQGILLLHIGAKRRSFAHCCIGGCDGYYGEFAMILESSAPSDWQCLEHVLAHESLHLFGADDLYNISAAKLYSPRDIMNYPSRFLSGSTLEGISAWAVGLLDTRPATPFPVMEN
jgi:hypothetical protein